MDDILLKQLSELAVAFNGLGIKPVVCGGLGVYLCLHGINAELQSMIRATNDIDLMITRTQVLGEARAHAIAEVITGDLKYIVRKDCKHFRFERALNQQLDILSPPIEGYRIQGERVKFVKSKLHGRLTSEARFIDEDLKTINLSEVFAINTKKNNIEVQVPSPTNFLMLKLCAFYDRSRGDKEDRERAATHAFDIYIIIMLTTRDDYLEGQQFLLRHGDSEEIHKVISIVRDNFTFVNQLGWQRVLETTSFYSDQNVQTKRNKLEEAKNRLVRWFTLPV